MKLLALESSAVSASVCIMEDGKVLGESFVNIPQTHSQTLMVMVQALLSRTNLTVSDMDVLAVSAGPGSFTGVRIGVSCVKGMAMAEQIPCVAVSTLEAMAENCRDCTGIVCAVMDARCQQVYHAMFRAERGEITRLTEDRALSIVDLAAECTDLQGPIYLVGDGAALCFNSEAFQAIDDVRLVPELLRYQRAGGVAAAAMRKAEARETVSAGELNPIYLRLPQAERELKRKQKLEGRT